MSGSTGGIMVSALPVDRSTIERVIDWQIRHYATAFPSFDFEDWLAFYAPWIERGRGVLPQMFGATSEGVLVGSLAIVERDDLEDIDEFSPWIAALIVDPKMRGRGIGTTLMNTALDWCRDHGFERVYLWTHDQSDWYRRTGWAEEKHHEFRNIDIVIFSRRP